MPLAETLLPGCGEGLQSCQGTAATAMDACAHQGHLGVETVQENLLIQRGAQTTASPELTALPQQTVVAANEVAVDRFQLQHDPVEPLTPQRWLTTHQMQIQRTEAHTAKGPDQIHLTLQHLAVASCLSSSPSPQFKLHHILICAGGPEHSAGGVPVDQIRILAGSMRAKAAQQLHRFEQVGFADPVAADHQ